METHHIPTNTTRIYFYPISEVPEASFVLEKDARAILFFFGSGTMIGDRSITVLLNEEGASADIIGIFSLSGNSKVNLKTLQHHNGLNTKSNLLVKTVLRDNAEFKYDGAIRVEKTGQKTDAYQRNENLLLSPGSWAESKPSLEILANDVRCTHGATISTVSEEQLFYLRSRGISREKASEVLVSGFLSSAIEKTIEEVVKNGKKEELWQNIEKFFPFLNSPMEA